MLAEFAIYPTDEAHLSRDVAEMIYKILEEAGVDYRLGPTSTSVEGQWDAVIPPFVAATTQPSRTMRVL